MSMSPDRKFEFRFKRPPEIGDLTPEIADDLYDIVRKFGQVFPEEQAVRFNSGNIGLNFELSIIASTRPDFHNMLVGKSTTEKLVDFTLIKARGAAILWDRSLSAEEARQAVIKIDEGAAAQGLIDPETKKRKPIPAEAAIHRSPILYQVDSVFTNPGAGFLVPPEQDPKKVLQQFDQPERLTLFHDPLGGITIHLKESLPRLQRRSEIVQQILRQKGIDITNPSDIDKLSWSDIAALRSEIQRRVQEAEEKSENSKA